MRLAHDQRGFTLPELLVTIVVTMIFTGIIIIFTFDYWRGTATLESDNEVYVTRLNAGDKLRDLLNASSGLVSQNSIADQHTNNADPAIPSGYYWIPLHAIPGNKAVGSNGTTTPLIYFRQPAVDSAKNFILNGIQPYENEYILYMNGTTKQLLLRTLANSSASGNAALTSCPPAIATSSCPADKVIADNLDSIDMRYFSRAGNTIDYTSIIDNTVTPAQYIGPDFTAVEVVELNLHLTHRSTVHGGQDTTNQTVIRVALRNA